MASSGSAYTAFARHRLVLEWNTRSQNIANNNSVVRGSLYLQSMDAYGAIYAGALGQAKITLNGGVGTGNATGAVNAYQKKLLLAWDFPVGHNADGTKTFSVSGSFYINVTFNGVYYGTININAFNGTLNTIPRKSSLNPIPSFTLPNKPTFSIARQSSSFTHNVTFWVENRANPTLDNDSHYTYINGAENVGTSGSIPLTPAQVSQIINSAFKNNKASASSGKMKLWTRQLSESSPSQQRSMMISLPAKATASGGYIDISVGREIKGELRNFNGDTNFSYDLVWEFNGYSKTIATTFKSKSWRYNLTQADVDAMLKAIPNAKESWGQVRVTSKYNGTAYGGTNQGDKISVTVNEADVNPVLNGTPTLADSNTVSVGVTGNAQSTIQGLSKLAVTTPANFVTARGSATLKTITVSHGGVSTTANYVAGGQTITLPAPTSTSATAISVSVTDSRGYTTDWTSSVPVYPYTNPKPTVTAQRRNSFQVETDVQVRGSWSPITVNGVNKNTIQKLTIEYKLNRTTTWGSPANVPFTISGDTIVGNPILLNLPNEGKYDIRITVQDRVATTSATVTVPAGKPIMFIDVERRSVSFGDLTGQSENLFKSTGAIEVEASQWHPDGRVGIQMNNSDIAGVNALWFPDPADNDREGIHFIKSGKEMGSMNKDDYDHLYMRDKGLYINNNTVPLFTMNYENSGYEAEVLWTGAWYMGAGQSSVMKKSIFACRNGWALVFSKYQTDAPANTDIFCYLIHKAALSVGTNWYGVRIPVYNKEIALKTFHIEGNGTTITGVGGNGTNDISRRTVLRGVYAW